MKKQMHLDRDFISQFVGKQPKWGPVGYVTYKRTYARSIEPDDDGLYSVPESIAQLGAESGLKKTEEFWLTLVRVTEGTFEILRNHCERLHLPWDDDRGQKMMQEMYWLMWGFKFSPPGRGLWMMGTEAIKTKGAACLNNCGFFSTNQIDTDFSAPFCFLMDMSMLGVGVGGDTRGAGKVTIVQPMVGSEHIVDDSREGWIELLRRILDAFVGKGDLPSSIDYSKIRLSGTRIRTFGGTASGPEPLMLLVKDVISLLTKRIGKKLRSSDIVDIFNLTGRCVVAGNVRRSAEIMFGDSDDISFLDLKDPEKNLSELMSHRWASNNSIWATVGQDYTNAAARTARNGEPGYMWLENARKYSRMIDPPDWKDKLAAGGNPCLEQTLESGELCCLVETYPAHHESFEEYQRTLKYAYLYAKAVTLVPTHDQRTNAVLLRNRRIGTSMAGVTQAISKFGLRNLLQVWCDGGYKYLTELDDEYSGWLCVPSSKKKTSLKPGGTTPLLPGARPGIHWPKSEFYFRVIRIATNSPFIPILRNAGYNCIEIDPAREPNTTACYFAVKEPDFTRSIKDVSMWEQLELAAQMQAYWADNQVSVTIEFDQKTEGPQIARALELYETRLKGVSFLPKSLENTGYIHAPYQPITEEEYLEYTKKLKPYDLNSTSTEVEDKFCDTDSCQIPIREKVNSENVREDFRIS